MSYPNERIFYVTDFVFYEGSLYNKTNKNIYLKNINFEGKEARMDFFREDILVHLFHDMWHVLRNRANALI